MLCYLVPLYSTIGPVAVGTLVAHVLFSPMLLLLVKVECAHERCLKVAARVIALSLTPGTFMLLLYMLSQSALCPEHHSTSVTWPLSLMKPEK